MTEKRFVEDHSYLVNYDKYCILDKLQAKHLYLHEVLDLLNNYDKDNKQLKVLLKEAEDEIENLKKSKQGLLESIVENDSNKAMISEIISNLRENGFCEGCKNKDKPVEWYLERGLSITEGVCNSYEPED